MYVNDKHAGVQYRKCIEILSYICRMIICRLIVNMDSSLLSKKSFVYFLLVAQQKVLYGIY